MIVITGPGRSGTSFLASVYEQLGFSPVVGGGGWATDIRGGLEDIEIGQLNARMIDELGLRSPLFRLADRLRKLGAGLGHQAGSGDNQGTPNGAAPSGGAPVRRQLEGLAETLAARTIGARIPLMRWERMAAVVDRHGPEMRRLAAARDVAKDPAFCLTLWAWAAAGAEIDHVLISLRSLEVTASGLLKSGHLPQWARQTAENRVAYRLGLLLAAVVEHRLPYDVIRFPDYLQNEQLLYDALRFPQPVAPEQLKRAIEAVSQPDFVSSWK